jgi:hypothetical protein
LVINTLNRKYYIMKKNSILLIVGLASLILTSCIKEDIKTFQGESVVEIDAAVLNTRPAGVTYPIITRIPVGSRPPITSSDSTIRRLNTTRDISIRINLVGPHSSKDETVAFRIFDTPPVATVAFALTATGQTPSAGSATLTMTSAIPNTHFIIAASGIITIPANSSYGYIDVKLLNNGPTASSARFLGIELIAGGSIRPNPNYNKLGIAIDQR